MNTGEHRSKENDLPCFIGVYLGLSLVFPDFFSMLLKLSAEPVDQEGDAVDIRSGRWSLSG